MARGTMKLTVWHVIGAVAVAIGLLAWILLMSSV
jgi:hypothetical protein